MKKISSILFLFFIILLTINCKNNSSQSDNNSDSSQTVTTTNTNTSNAVSYDFEELSFSNSDISSDLYVGNIIVGKKWKDKSGVNYFFISEKKTTVPSNYGDLKSYEIHGYHFVELNGDFELIREIKDFQSDCDLLSDCGLCDNSLELTDINNDNYGEISFLYFLYCAMDASPRTLKLMLFENGAKFPIRGETYVNYGSSAGGGETNLGQEFDNAPSAFKDFALNKWTKFQNIESGILPEVSLLDPFMDVKFTGTEPFWSLTLYEYGFFITENIGEPERFFEYTSIGKRGNDTWDITAKEGNVYFDLTIVKENCTDGMSDNQYSYSIEVKRANKSPLNGCCCKK